ncbi:MAG: NAD(P)-binding domain-containing protein [Pseudomonadota bacterium]|nr:NAD(P)-binding domain-containing protein [Pseudomonadota bacterium]
MSGDMPSVCVIGAGSSGITACKNFKQRGIPFECIESSDCIGGMWVLNNAVAFNGKSSAYQSLHINTSRRQMAYADFPMPANYPDFPSHEQIVKYLNDYVDHFDLRTHIRFNTTVTHCRRLDNGVWEVTFDNGETREYDALVVANGHHWDPCWPEPRFPGVFNGVEMHAHDYLSPTQPHDLRGKNVVIVGMGNSAMDIASELGRGENAHRVFLSARTGTYILPKYLFHKLPMDRLARHPSQTPGLLERISHLIPARFKDTLSQPLMTFGLNLLVGRPEHYGLPAPKGWFGQQHPTISSEIHIRLGSGDVTPKPNIQELQGDTVSFVDGTQERADAIIYCTGYKISFPFFDSDLIPSHDNDIALYMRMMDPCYDNLFFLGLVQPLCAMMPIADEQSKWMAAYLAGEYHTPPPEVMRQRMVDEHEATKRRYIKSRRHTIQINCQEYTYSLWRDLNEGRKRAALADHRLPVVNRTRNSITHTPEAPVLGKRVS